MDDPKDKSIFSFLITQTIAVVVFVLVPLAITLIAPLSSIEIRRSEYAAVVTVQRYALLFIPWRTERIASVTRFRADITAETHYRDTSENRRKGQTGVSLATGQVAIISEGPEVIVQADPELAQKISKQFEEFMTGNAPGPVTFNVYASWWLSYILGGAATAFCALYAVAACVAAFMFLLKQMRAPKPNAAK